MDGVSSPNGIFHTNMFPDECIQMDEQSIGKWEIGCQMQHRLHEPKHHQTVGRQMIDQVSLDTAEYKCLEAGEVP